LAIITSQLNKSTTITAYSNKALIVRITAATERSNRKIDYCSKQIFNTIWTRLL